MNADINTHVQVRRDRQARQDRQTERQTGRGGGDTVSSRLRATRSHFLWKRLTVVQSHIYRQKESKLRVILLPPPPTPDVENESSEGWVSKFKVLLIRFHQFSPSQFLKHRKRSEKLFFFFSHPSLSKVKSLSVNVSSGRRKEEKVEEMHKGEEIGRKEGARRLGDGSRDFLIAFKSSIIASHPVQRHLARTHTRTSIAHVIRRCHRVHPDTHAHTHTHTCKQPQTHLDTVTHTSRNSAPSSSCCFQPSISRYTGEALARLSSRPWISLMLSLMCGSRCQQPSIRSYTSLGQVLGRCSTLPWVIHSITCRGRKIDSRFDISVQKNCRDSSWNVQNLSEDDGAAAWWGFHTVFNSSSNSAACSEA